MEIKRVEKQGITILTPTAPLIAGDAEHFGDIIHELGALGKTRVIVDMEAVGYADAIGISVLIRSYAYLSGKMGRLVLLNLQKRITDILAITKFLAILDVAETLDEAIRKCS